MGSYHRRSIETLGALMFYGGPQSKHFRLIEARPGGTHLDATAAITLVALWNTAICSRDVETLDSLLSPSLRAVVLGRSWFRSSLKPVRMSRAKYLRYLCRWPSGLDLSSYLITVDEVLSSLPECVRLRTSVRFPGSSDFRKWYGEAVRVDVTVESYCERLVFTYIDMAVAAPN